jgi:hypothetical protein
MNGGPYKIASPRELFRYLPRRAADSVSATRPRHALEPVTVIDVCNVHRKAFVTTAKAYGPEFGLICTLKDYGEV